MDPDTTNTPVPQPEGNTPAAAPEAQAPAAQAAAPEPKPEPSEGTPTAAGDGQGEGNESVGSASPPEGSQLPDKGTAAAPLVKDWKIDEITRLRAQNRELKAKVAGVPAAPSEPAAPPQPAAPAPDAVVAKAQELIAQQAFVTKCNDVAKAGSTAYTPAEFNSRMAQIKELVDPNDPSAVATYNRFLEAVVESEQPERVLYELGGDQNKAKQMLDLAATAPMKLVREVTLMGLKQGDADPSGAPKPVKPVGGRGAPHTQISPGDTERADKLSTAEWMARRQADIDARRKAGERVY